MTADRTPLFSFKRLLALIVVLAAGIFIVYKIAAPKVPDIGESTPMPYTINSENGPAGESSTGKDYNLIVGLSAGQAQQATPVPLPVVTGEPLTDEEIAGIFERLPNLPVSSSDQTEFKFPVELLPPPRPGTTIQQQFPFFDVVPTPEIASSEPLQVLRFAPEGEIPLAPFVSITFSQAMVPLGTLTDLADEAVAVTIDPPLPGTWRWLGTKTLTFEYDSDLIDRLPKATAYTVTIPAGTKSVSGGALAEAVSWSFSTPPAKVISMFPQNLPQPLEPLIFMGFDQRIDPAAVLTTIQLYAGNERLELRLATDAEFEQDEDLKSFVEESQEGRWLVFRAVAPLAPDTSISVTVGPGTPSAEGPLVTTETQSFSFSTYAPLKVLEYGCYWRDNLCTPLAPFYIRFNNPLDSAAFTQQMLRVTPEIPGMVVNVYGDTINISGETRGQTTYTVTLAGGLKDVFGQTLGKDVDLTFKVGKAEPRLFATDQPFVTLDPAVKEPAYSMYAINYARIDVSIYSVEPGDWEAFKAYLRDWQRTDVAVQLPGQQVFHEVMPLNLPDDTLSEVNIELAPYLKNGFGHFVVVVQPPAGMFESENDKWQRYSQTLHTWVQVTRIGLDAYTDYSDMLVWANDLRDGTPLAGVKIQPNPSGSVVTTGANGTVRFAIPSGAMSLTATLGADTALLPYSPYAWGDTGWDSDTPRDWLRWFVFDDRKMYRPGEEVHIKGWLRQIGGRQTGDVSLVGSGVSRVAYTLTDAQGNSLVSGQADVNALGGFDFALTIPQPVNLGQAYLNLSALGSLSGLDGAAYGHALQIQEFRRPEFEVKARNESSGPYFADGEALLAVQASYYAGGALPNADVTWEVSTTPGHYAPPNWPDFIFGEWLPWWWDFYRVDFPFPDGETKVETFTGKTDAAGTHFLQLDFKPEGEPDVNPQPMSISAQATVMDVNRQAWSSETTLLVHPDDLYIGLRSDRYFVEKGTPLKVEYIVADLDGNPVADRSLTLTAARLEWKLIDGVWGEVEVDPQVCSQVSTLEPGSCSFDTAIGGSYRITAVVTDEQGRKNQTRFTRWVSGGQRLPARQVEQEEVTLVPDKESYQPGETAEILVQSPFSPAEGLLTVSRSGFLYTTRFQLENGSTTLKVPILAEYIPNLNIQVDLVGSAPRMDDAGEPLKGVPPRPAFATAQLNLKIPPLQRSLTLDVQPDVEQLEPGGETTLQIKLTDAAGAPVADAELAVVVVDEAILALTNYQMADPISIFYSDRYSGVSSVYGRSSIILANPLSLLNQRDGLATGSGPMPTQVALQEMAAMAPAAADMAKSGDEQAQQPDITVRSDFNPLAVFAPTVRTSDNGEARIFIRVPDNLTRYRIMVVAVDDGGQRFGVGESNVTARLPLMVRPSAPRFLNFGDRFELPVILQNQTDADVEVEVVARATNLELAAPGLRVTVPANDRIEVRFPATTQLAGTARIQIAAISGTYADAAVVELPVYTPATTEAFATYGVVDEGALAQPVLYPSGVFPQYGGLEINTSSTALQALTDAVLYLTSYPFEGSEQLASRILAVAAVRDVLTAFEADGLPTPAEMESAVTRDLKSLQGLQNSDGGFPYWRRSFSSSPFNTVHVAHSLVRANQKGFSVPADMLQAALSYLRDIESHYPHWYSQATRWTLSAYALNVRNLAGDRDAAKALRLFNEAGIDNLSMEAIGWLWPVIDSEPQLDEIRRFVANRVVETPGAANFTTAYDDQTYLLLSSDRRTDAILLDALMEDDPQSDLIVKVVNGLLAHRVKGRWENTQENVFVLLALDKYFNTYESQTPDFVARLWLGNTYAGSNEFHGRTTDNYETLIPMTYVLSETGAAGGTQDLILSKEGSGRLYYRLGLRYAPTDLDLDPLDMGFVVQRSYEAVDDPADVSRDNEGNWHIKAGARVKIHITLVADSRRYHVALVDPLPAGLEIINPALAVSQDVPQDDPTTLRYGWWWWGTWYEHQNLRDDRAEAFTTLLWDGVYQYSYFARATTPGTFIVPPAKAEEMYSPEVFGRSSSDQVIVE
ncbi:MAG TPA: Ig-like domain-containing protein [Bellilinea sp.]|nr:Ig-like domain-containing protein [Bellilinea sp.]